MIVGSGDSQWLRKTDSEERAVPAAAWAVTMGNAIDLRSYRQRRRDRGYKRLDVWFPALLLRNLNEDNGCFQESRDG